MRRPDHSVPQRLHARPRVRERGRALVLLSVLAMLGLLGRSGHMLMVNHVWCAAHGEVTHSAHAEQAPPDADARAAVDRGDGDDDHDHCDMLAAGEAPAVEAPSAPEVLPALLAEDAASGLAALDPRRLWLLAPKTSPPA